ncbi:MAG: ribosomal L7Ae/L30e/S12e/Gadd45 family protein [Anaerovoracaceae bacterium]
MKKVNSYLGFARKSGNMVMGSGTCSIYMKKKKIKLLIITTDTADNSKEKLVNEAEKTNTKYRVYGNSDEISHLVGSPGRTSFGITDKQFAETILKEIDKEGQ